MNSLLIAIASLAIGFSAASLYFSIRCAGVIDDLVGSALSEEVEKLSADMRRLESDFHREKEINDQVHGVLSMDIQGLAKDVGIAGRSMRELSIGGTGSSEDACRILDDGEGR